MKWLISGLVLFAGAWFGANQASSLSKFTNTDNRVEAATAPVTSSVHALGRLEPNGRVLNVAVPSGNEGNRLEMLFVVEGESVKSGQVLARMDTYARRRATLAESSARLNAVEARLAQVRAGNKQGDIEAARAMVDSAEHALAIRQRERERAERLKQSNAVSAAEVDTAQLVHKQAVQMLRQKSAELTAISEVREVDVQLAIAELDQAKASLEIAKANLAATEVYAPTDGRILKIHSRSGEQVQSNGVLDLGRVDEMQAVAEVFEGDVPKLRIGQQAIVQLDTTGDRMEGVVNDIGYVVARKVVLTNDPISDTDARIVEVRIDLRHSKLDCISRMSNARVQVQIKVDAQ